MPYCRGMPGQGSRNGWVGEQGIGDRVGGFQRGNKEGGTFEMCCSQLVLKALTEVMCTGMVRWLSR